MTDSMEAERKRAREGETFSNEESSNKRQAGINDDDTPQRTRPDIDEDRDGDAMIKEAGERDAGQEDERPNPNISMRALINSKEVGLIIGKAGATVREIRDISGARVVVSEKVLGAIDRVVTVDGPLDTVAKAFAVICEKLIMDHYPNNTPEELKTHNTTLRLLVPHSRMGLVIGKQGSKLKETQEASGARISASEEKLPNSTERIVSILGVIDSIHIATYHIGLVLQSRPHDMTGHIPYRPGPPVFMRAGGGGGGSSSSGGYMNGGGRSDYRHDSRSGGGGGGGYGHGSSNGGGGGGDRSGYDRGRDSRSGGVSHSGGYESSRREGPPSSSGGGGGIPSSGGTEVKKIFIPDDMVGPIIGKGGLKIKEIREQSGSMIKVGDPDGSNERTVILTGTSDSNEMAAYLIHSRVDAEKARKLEREQQQQ